MERVQKKDEVDLMEVFLNAIITIRKNFWLILLFFVLGTVLGLVYYTSAKKVYQSKMVVSSRILTNSYSKALIDKINTFRREQNRDAIKTLLHISDSTAINLVSLEVQRVSAVDDLKETDKFIITANVFDHNVLPDLQQGLVYYLENNDYVKVRVEQDKKYLDGMIAKVDQEIKDMERFKEKIVSGTFYETVKGNVMFDPTTVNSKILELTKEKLTLQNNLEVINSVHVIEGFSQFDRPSSPQLSVSLVSGSLVGLFFVGCLIAFKSIRRLLRMADAAKQTP
jgi:hypothetical protein